MAASIVGGAMQGIAATQENRAMTQAFNQELQAQLGLSDQAYGTLLGSLPQQGAEAAGKYIDQGAQDAQQQYTSLQNTPLLASGDSNIGGGMYGATDKAALQQEGAARSKISGLSNWKLNNMINDIKTSDAINRVNFRSQGLNQVFPYKMYAAQHSQDELAAWGQMISSIGGGGGGGAAQTFSSPPPTQQQYSAMNAGYGPVNAGFAQGLGGNNSTLFQGFASPDSSMF